MRPPFSAPSATVLLATVLVLLPTGSAFAGDEGQSKTEPEWGSCVTTGKTEFEVDRKYDMARGSGEGWEMLFSSTVIESENMGLPWQICRRCKDEDIKAQAQADWDAIKAANDAWLAERRKVDTRMGFKKPTITHVESTHFVIAWDVAKTVKTSDKKSYRPWQAAHLYVARLEELYADYQRMFAVEDKNNLRNKHYLYVFDKLAEIRKASPMYTGLPGETTAKRSGGADKLSAVATWWDKSIYSTDDDFFRHLTHSMIHQFTAVYYDIHWFKPGEFGLVPPWLNDKYGWLDAGLAHWFERRQEGAVDTYCIREQDNTSRWKGPDWHKNVWKAVKADVAPSFAEVSSLPTQALSAQQHQFCWSWIDYLLSNFPQEKMGRAIRCAKEEKRAGEILKEAFGLSMLNLEPKWKEWVLVEYSPNNRKGDDVWQPRLPGR